MPRRDGVRKLGRGRNPQGSKRKRAEAPKAGDSRERTVNAVLRTNRLNRPKLLPLVPPTGTCPTGKIRYGSSVDASEALRRARINRPLMGSETVEDHWYPQPGDRPCVCGGFHLTSKERKPPAPRDPRRTR
jgi:hypothetical protein